MNQLRVASSVNELKGDLMLVFFSATWSEPCQAVSLVLSQLASDLPPLTVYKV